MACFIKQRLAETTTSKVRLAIMKALDSMLEKLTEKLSVENDVTPDINEILPGPKRGIQKSRMDANSSKGSEEGKDI